MSKFVNYFLDIQKRFSKSEIPLRAAGLAYHSLLAIIPTLGLVVWYLKSIGITATMYREAEKFIFSNLSVTASSTVSTYLSKMTGNVSSQSWGWVGLGVLIYTVWNLLMKFGNSIDKVFGTFDGETHITENYFLLLGRRFLLILGLPFSLAISLAFFTWVRHDSWLKHLFNLKTAGTWFALPIPLIADILALFFIYKFAPQTRVPWKQALKAAAIVSVFFELAKFGMGVYSRYAITNQKIYGALAALPIFIIWVQLIWIIILTGALLIRFNGRPKLENTRNWEST